METCPECGTQMIPQNGCTYCPYCGYSICQCSICTSQDEQRETDHYLLTINERGTT